MKKRSLLSARLFAVILAIITLVPGTAAAASLDIFALVPAAVPVSAPDDGFEIIDGVLTGYFGDATEIVIPDGVTSIGDEAFYHFPLITSVVIPHGVTSIGNWAFAHCFALESVEIPGSVTSIGDYAFVNCYVLTPLVIPNGVVNIGEFAFLRCYSLTAVVIPNSVKTIGEGAFWQCAALESVVIPASITYIGWGSFDDCSPALIIYGEAGSYADEYARREFVAFSDGESVRTQYTYRGNYEWNKMIYSSKLSDEATLAYYLETQNLFWTDDQEIQEIFALASSITEGISSDYEKARAISFWVADNIYYDTDFARSLSDDTVIVDDRFDGSSSGILEHRRGVCGNYADLIMALLRAAGIPAKYILGDVFNNFGAEFAFNHAWNEAFVDGRWIIIDTTWNTRNGYENGEYFKGEPIDKYFDISIKDISLFHKYAPYFDPTATEAVIPAGLTRIDSVMFSGLSYLEKVYIPASVTSIGENAFMYCYNLTIYGEAGSYAEIYARKNGINFKAVSYSPRGGAVIGRTPNGKAIFAR
jgi:hypothetical protein